MFAKSLFTIVAIWCIFFACGHQGWADGQTATPSPLFASSQNLDLFEDKDAAIAALAGPTMEGRQNAVAYLGRWTGADGSESSADAAAARADFALWTELVPSLAMVVKHGEQPYSELAGRLLALMGRRAIAAFPAVCSAIGSTTNSSPNYPRDDLVVSAVKICGSSVKMTDDIVALLRSSSAVSRSEALSALPYLRVKAVQMSSVAAHANEINPRNDDFLPYDRAVLPEAAMCLSDKDRSVRLATLYALQLMTLQSAEAPWSDTIQPLSEIVVAGDVEARDAAVKLLDLEQADISAAAPALKAALETTDEHDYALDAIDHAVLTGRIVAVNVFLADLKSPVEARRVAAARDVDECALILFDGAFNSGPFTYDWNNDDRLSGFQYPYDMESKSEDGLAQLKQDARTQAQALILHALTDATRDPNTTVSGCAGSALLKIGTWLEILQGFGGPYCEGGRSIARPSSQAVAASLKEAADNLVAAHPGLSKQALKLSQDISRGPIAVI
jgi:hypothetical protein